MCETSSAMLRLATGFQLFFFSTQQEEAIIYTVIPLEGTKSLFSFFQ